jgi:hypothetical protein
MATFYIFYIILKLLILHHLIEYVWVKNWKFVNQGLYGIAWFKSWSMDLFVRIHREGTSMSVSVNTYLSCMINAKFLSSTKSHFRKTHSWNVKYRKWTLNMRKKPLLNVSVKTVLIKIQPKIRIVFQKLVSTLTHMAYVYACNLVYISLIFPDEVYVNAHY